MTPCASRPWMTGISCTVHVPVMSLQYLEAMKNHRPRHDAIDLSVRELDSCPPLTAAEEQEMSLRILWFRKRLAVLLGELPEPQQSAPGLGPHLPSLVSSGTQWTSWGSDPCVAPMQTHVTRPDLCWPKSCITPVRSREGHFSVRANPTVRRRKARVRPKDLTAGLPKEGEVPLGFEGSSEPGGRRS
jgi:hypothetical protein